MTRFILFIKSLLVLLASWEMQRLNTVAENATAAIPTIKGNATVAADGLFSVCSADVTQRVERCKEAQAAVRERANKRVASKTGIAINADLNRMQLASV